MMNIYGLWKYDELKKQFNAVCQSEVFITG